MCLLWGVAHFHGQPFFSSVDNPPNQTYVSEREFKLKVRDTHHLINEL
jgi:hypothetical protein